MEATNIDNILLYEQTPAESFVKADEPELTKEPETSSSEPIASPEPINTEVDKELTSDPKKDEETPENSDVEVNEYGIEVPKKEARVYTEAEVNEMFRKRFKNNPELAQQQPFTPQEQAKIQQDFQYNDNNPEDWQKQLDGYINNAIERREKSVQEQQWRQQEAQQQAEFEIKFNSGAEKYADFQEVVVGKPLTAQMVLATRTMSDPAGFIYAAAKTQPAELARIAQIQDPFAQAVEMGQLSERMKKSRPLTTGAPKPISVKQGDVADKEIVDDADKDIDTKLRLEEKRRISNVMARR